MRIALLVPDGVGIRNFVIQSPFSDGVLVLHRCPEEFLEPLERVAHGAGNEFVWREMEGLEERPIPFALRQCLIYAHLFWGDTHAMRMTRNRAVGGSWKTKLADKTGRFIGRMASWPAGIRMLEALHYCSVKNCREAIAYRGLFEQERPSLLLSTNHRMPSTLPAVLAAKSCGIPTVSFVASWDNLTSKGRVAAPFDYYLVWSQNMRKELLRFHPHVLGENVFVVGTPQFDIYADRDALWSRADFFKQVGGDPNRPLICYSGGDSGTCPEDQDHVRILLDLVRQGHIQGNPQILVRPSPVDNFRRYDLVRSDYPELIYLQPKWEWPADQDWSRCVPSPEDVKMIANLTYHCDMNVNVASTMTLDFSIRDKPVVNIAFDVTDPPPAGVPLWDLYYQWEHYRPVTDLGAARIARSRTDLADHVNAYLSNPGLDREGRRRLVELQVGTPIGQGGAQIRAVLGRLASWHD